MSVSLHVGTPERLPASGPDNKVSSGACNLHNAELPPPEPVTYIRCRVSRMQERAPKHVRRSVPKGSKKADHGLYEALPALRNDKRLATLTKPLQRRLTAFYEQLILLTDYESMTVRVPWGGRGKAYKEENARHGLAEWLGICRRTVATYRRMLEEWGYLGTVARGRSAEFEREKTAEGNELPVYVICVPKTSKDKKQATVDVDKTCTPTAPLGVEQKEPSLFLTRTRATSIQMETATPPQKSVLSGGASAAVATTCKKRTEIFWPLHATTKRKGQRWGAAAEIRKENYALRPLPAKDLASVLKPWLKAAWTVSDIRHALDTKADGTLWPHSGAPVTRNTQRLREWVRTRLTDWTVEGVPMTPPSQRRAAQEAHSKALRRIEQERELIRRTEHAAYLAQGPSDTEIRAKAALRAIFAANKVRKP